VESTVVMLDPVNVNPGEGRLLCPGDLPLNLALQNNFFVGQENNNRENHNDIIIIDDQTSHFDLRLLSKIS